MDNMKNRQRHELRVQNQKALKRKERHTDKTPIRTVNYEHAMSYYIAGTKHQRFESKKEIMENKRYKPFDKQ